MAWTLDAKVENKTKTDDPIVTSFTTGVGAKLLVVSLVVDNALGLSTSVTFDGVALTNSTAYPGLPFSGQVRIYYLIDPPIKTANISVVNGGANSISMIAASFINTASCSLRSTSRLANMDAINPVSATMTDLRTGDLIYAAIISGAATWNPTATDGTQLYDADVGDVGAGAQFFVATSNNPLTLGWTFATSDSYNIITTIFTIPVTGAGEYISMQRGIKNKPRQAPLYTDDAI